MKTISKCLFIAATAMLLTFSALAQPKITLSHAGVPSFYTNLSTAVTAAVNGDTLYLTGGTIQPSVITVAKSLHIVGTGHYPDSTLATGVPLITDISFLTGSGGGSIEGCKITSLKIGYAATQNIINFSVRRCFVSSLNVGLDNASTIVNIFLTDNILTVVTVKEGYPGIFFYRNVFNSSTLILQGLMLKNNIINTNGNNSLSGLIGCVLSNNIIIGWTYSLASLYLTSNNCHFVNNLLIPNVIFWGTNTQVNSIVGQTPATTFINAPSSPFMYDYNYHLLTSSPGKNYGTDGTDVGIYGTSTPYKDGAVPFNPHIMSKYISPELTPAGALNINITVSAQDY